MKGIFRLDASSVDWCWPCSCILPPVALSPFTVSQRACSFFTATILLFFYFFCLTVAKVNLICLPLGICSSKLSLDCYLLNSKQVYAIVSRQSPSSLTPWSKLLTWETLSAAPQPAHSLHTIEPFESFHFSHFVIVFMCQMTLPPPFLLFYLFFQNQPSWHLCLASCSPPRQFGFLQLEHGSVSHLHLLSWWFSFHLDSLFIHVCLSYKLYQSSDCVLDVTLSSEISTVLMWGRRWVGNTGSMVMDAAWVYRKLLLSTPHPFYFPYSGHWDFFGSLPKYAQFESVSALVYTCTFSSSPGQFLHIPLVSAPIYPPIFPTWHFHRDVPHCLCHQPPYGLILYSQVYKLHLGIMAACICFITALLFMPTCLYVERVVKCS